ncbi:MAG: GYF domain-containing protein, partial [Allobaculum sp.]|nr:GYF domain-containing protein [Allobaculum sp.]
MKNCSVCHSEVQEDAKFCPECGASFSQPNTLESKNSDGQVEVEIIEESIPDASSLDSTPTKKERWYYVEDGQSVGPFDRSELLDKLSQNLITPETYIWSKGMKEWTQLQNTDVYNDGINGIFSLAPVAEVIEDGVSTPIETFEAPDQSLDLNKNSNDVPPQPIKLDVQKDEISKKIPPTNPMKIPPLHKNEKEENSNDTQDWYYVVNGRTVGPFSETVMIRNIHQGVIDGTTYVWKEGYLDWQHLKDTPLAVYLSDAVRPNETILPGQNQYYPNYQSGVSVRNIILYL